MILKDLLKEELINESVFATTEGYGTSREILEFIETILDLWERKKIIKSYEVKKGLGYIKITLPGLGSKGRISINAKSVKGYKESDGDWEEVPVKTSVSWRFFKKQHKNVFVGLLSILKTLPKFYKEENKEMEDYFKYDTLEEVYQETVRRFRREKVTIPSEYQIKIEELP